MKNTRSSFITVIFCFFLLISTFGLQAQHTQAEKILQNFHENKEILVVSHRAAHQKYPENSIKAIQECIRLGVDIVELDVRKTKDGVLVIMHDSSIDRTTNGKGKVSKLTWAELQELYLVVDGKTTNEKIPTFEEVLKVTKDKILIDVDFKADSKKAAKDTYTLIEKHGMEDQILFFLYNYKKLPKLRKLNRAIKIMPRAYSEKDVTKILEYGNIDIIHVDESYYTPSFMKNLADKGIRVWMNTLGKYDRMERVSKNSGFNEMLKKKYVNVIQTDLPEELLQFLKAKKLHH